MGLGPAVEAEFIAVGHVFPLVKEYERMQLLERIERDGATVGARIPERITVQGTEVGLRELVFETKRRDVVSSDERERVDEVKKNLRRERLERRQRLEGEAMEYDEAERLADTIVGIDRALNALESLEPTDLEDEIARLEQADKKRWLSFLKSVLGHDDDQGRHR